VTGTAAAPAALRALLTPEAVRERCEELWRQGESGALPHFMLDPHALDAAAACVAEETQRNYPDLRVPPHSRWRHFELHGRDLWREVEREAARLTPASPGVIARSRFDLAMVSVLLDAGAGPRWRYRDAASGLVLSRSEGLAVASLRLFQSGVLSDAGDADPLRADAAALSALTSARLATALQAGPDNPIAGLEQRCALLNGLGHALRAQPEVFRREDATRPGHLFDTLRARTRGGPLPARSILIALLETLGGIWPGGRDLGGVRAGDVGEHPGVRRDDGSDRLVPFHKLSQWLAYSLVEPLQEAGVRVAALDALTGLPEYRNGGLLMDTGVLRLREAGEAGRPQDPAGTLVTEWRALTVVGLDRIATRVRRLLGLDPGALPLASVLQGGTWSAGRRLAAARRPGGEPPLVLALDGAIF
jgi:hypothetical protein